MQALPALLSRLPDVERGITRILHRTASPAEFVTTVRALAGVGAALRLAAVDDEGRIVVDSSVAQSELLLELLQAAASPEVCHPFLPMLHSVTVAKQGNLVVGYVA